MQLEAINTLPTVQLLNTLKGLLSSVVSPDSLGITDCEFELQLERAAKELLIELRDDFGG